PVVEPETGVEEFIPPAAQSPVPVVNAEVAHSETEAVLEPVVPVVAEPVKEEDVVEAMVAPETEADKAPIVASTVVEEVTPASEIPSQTPTEPVMKAEVAHSETEVVAEPVAAESVKDEEVVAPPVEAAVAPETEADKEPIVASTVVEEVVPPASEIPSQTPTELVTKAEVDHSETKVVAEPVAAEPVKDEDVVTPPVEATVTPETEAIKEPIVASTVVEEVVPPAAEGPASPAPVANAEVAHRETEVVPEPIVASTVVEEVVPSAAEGPAQSPAPVANAEVSHSETEVVSEPVVPVAAESVKDEDVVAPPVEATVAPETEADKEQIVVSTVVEEVVPRAAESPASPAPVANAEVAHSETEIVSKPVVPVAAESVKHEDVVTPSVEATVAPETEADKEPIVASTVVEEVAPPASEIATQTEPVMNVEVAPSEEATSSEPAATESVSVDSALVASDHAQPSATPQVHVPSEPITENASASTEPPVSIPVEKVSTATPAELPEVDDEPAGIPSTEPSAEIEPTSTDVQEVVVESSTVDTDVHTSTTKVPTQVDEEPVSVNDKATTEEAITNPITPAVAENTKEEVTVNPPVEAPVTPEIETVELNNRGEAAPSTEEPTTESAVKPVASAEDVPSEVTVTEPVTHENVVSVDDVIVSSEPIVAEAHIPSETISGDANTSTEAPVSVPIEKVSIVSPAEPAIANDQLTEVESSAVLSAETPSALDAVQEAGVTESVAADVDVHASAEVPTEVEEPVLKPVASKVAEPEEEEVVEVAPTESTKPSASEVVPEEGPTAPTLETQDVATAVSEHPETSIEPGASEHTAETIPTPTTQDDVASTNVIPVIEKPGNVAITAINETTPSAEDTAPLATAVDEEPAAKDADIPSDVILAADRSETEEPVPASLPAQPSLTDVVVEDSATVPDEKVAPTPADTMKGHVIAQDNEDTTIVDVPSTVDELRVSTQEGSPALLEETPDVDSVTSVELSTVESPAVAAEERSAEPKASVELESASEEPVGTSEPLASSDVTPSVSHVDESAGPQEGSDVIEQTKVVVEEENVLSQDAEKPVISIVEKTPSISAVEEAASTHVPEAPSTEKEAPLIEQMQGVSAEEVSRTLVETSVEAPVEELTQHEEAQAPVEESSPTKQAETVVEIEDKVDSPKDVPLIVEEATSKPISDVAFAEKEQVQTDVVVEEPVPTETTVNAAAEKVDLISTAETIVAKNEETLDVEEDKHLEVTESKDQIEPPKDAKAADQCSTTAAATSVESVTASPMDVTPSLTTIAATEEASTEEPTLSREEVEAVIATVPSVSEPADIAEAENGAVNASKSVVEVDGQTNSDKSKETTEENIALHVGADVERPKSPWMPSFQVTNVGRGASPDEQSTEHGVAETAVDSCTETKREAAEAEVQPTEKAPASVPVTADVEENSRDVEQLLISTPQLVIDKSLLIEATEAEKLPTQEPSTFLSSTHSQGKVELETDLQEPPARPWTPSYSVHSQGSPLSTHASLIQEYTPQKKEEPFVPNEDGVVDLEEMKLADDDSAPLGKQAQSQQIPANVFTEEQEISADVAPPLTAEVETQHRLEATGPSVQATSDSVHEVGLSKAIATDLERNTVLQVEDVNSSLAEAATPVTEFEVPRLVLDSSKEVSVPSVVAPEQIFEGPGPHVEERPASPWVPSYSVVVQGSPAQERPNPFETTVLGTSKDVDFEATASEAPTVLTKNVVDTETRDHEVAKQTEEPPENSTMKAVEGPSNLTQELTKGPWFSQSNVTQEISTGQVELNRSSPAPLDQYANQQDTVTQNVSTEEKVDDKGFVAVDAVEAAENMAVNPVREAFPTTEQPAAEQPKESKPSGLRLTTSNANTNTDCSSASPDTISPATDRSRLESTGSSRFFPGGWFSPSKAMDESRPFFEVVQGEFSAQKVAAARDPSIDEGPSVAEQFTATKGEANKGPQSKEQKSRWCVIM
ncbi:hypothetical protein C0993_010642, partial [Termitomyces sp. T159_Od127]